MTTTHDGSVTSRRQFCTSCGSGLTAADRFCGSCGAVVAAQAPPLPPPPAAAPPAGEAAGTAGQQPPLEAFPVRRTPPRRLPKVVISKKMALVLGSVALLAVIGATTWTIIAAALRGGADTPEAAVTQALDSIQKKDLVGVFSVLSPRERDAIARAQKAAQEKIASSGVVEASEKASPAQGQDAGTDLVFDGIDVSISGTATRVSKVAEDVALVTIPTGKIEVKIDPQNTKGVIRAAYNKAGSTEPTTFTQDVTELGENRSGITLVTVRTDGRWYISATMSVLEQVNTRLGLPRGTIPTTLPEGADSPGEAARSAVTAAQTLDVAALAPMLADDEARAAYLYSRILDKADKSYLRFTTTAADFSDGPRDGARAQAIVSRLEGTVWNGERFSVNDRCLSGSSPSADLCLGETAFEIYSGTPRIHPLSLFAQEGKFALTTVSEHGAWKVSLLDSLADAVASAAASLSADQVIRLAGVTHGLDPQGELTIGQNQTVEFNDAGVAVRSLKIGESAVLTGTAAGDGYAGMVVHPADGSEPSYYYLSNESYAYQQRGLALERGDYKVVISSNNTRDEAVTVKLDEAATQAVFVECDCYTETLTDYRAKEVTVMGEGVELTAQRPAGASRFMTYTILVDGQGTALESGQTTRIPLAPGKHSLQVEVQSSRGGYGSSGGDGVRATLTGR